MLNGSGIADNLAAAKRYKDIYGTEATQYRDFYITGTQDEAKKAAKNDDDYYRMIKQKIEAQPIPEEVKTQILRDMRYVSYYKKQVLVLKVISGNVPYLFNDSKYFERHGSTTVQQSMKSYTDAVVRFTKAQSSVV